MTFEPFAPQSTTAPRIGPFAFSDFLSTMWRHTAQRDDSVRVCADSDGAVALVLGDQGVHLVGPEDLVDYRSPVGSAQQVLGVALPQLPSGVPYRFDSLPSEAALPFGRSLDAAGFGTDMVQHASTAVLELPTSYDEYQANLGKKERHETRRKQRRFEQAHGPARLVTYREPGPALLRFFRLHRLADGPKSAFMTPAMTRLFTDLVSLDGWQVDALYGDGPRSVAVGVSFVDDTGYYLYNSAYDPGFRESSPGVVLLATLIRSAIERNLGVFDFLKGDEQYKYRMGAEARPLYVLEGST